MKIKCIRSYGDYLTVGKEYPVINLADDERSCESVCDNGTDLFVFIPDSAHGDFELIDEKQEKPMNTKELTPPTPVKSEENYEQPQTRSDEPKFGDILHIKGHPYVFIRIDSDGNWVVYDETEEVEFCRAETFDEYAPNPHQEQRERILKRWQRKSLDNAHDTEVCIAEMRVSDLIDFVQENILAET